MRSLLVVALLMVTLLVAACSSPESTLEGKWVSKTGSIEFMKDKTGVINPPPNSGLPENVRFKWNVEGENQVQLMLDPPISKVVFGKLEGKSLVIEDDRFEKQ